MSIHFTCDLCGKHKPKAELGVLQINVWWANKDGPKYERNQLIDVLSKQARRFDICELCVQLIAGGPFKAEVEEWKVSPTISLRLVLGLEA